jgi:hypothetical protein
MGLDDNRALLPSAFDMIIYPNPFNDAANIRFDLPQPSPVNIIIYDLLGREVDCLLDSYMPAGNHSLLWHTDDLSSGIYFCRIAANYYRASKKAVLLK